MSISKIKAKSVSSFPKREPKIGSGDSYGTGVKNPPMKPKDIMGTKVSSMKKTMGKPPKSLA